MTAKTLHAVAFRTAGWSELQEVGTLPAGRFPETAAIQGLCRLAVNDSPALAGAMVLESFLAARDFHVAANCRGGRTRFPDNRCRPPLLEREFGKLADRAPEGDHLRCHGAAAALMSMSIGMATTPPRA
jgi:hypothetical protein